MTALRTQEHDLQKLPLGADDITAAVEEDIVLGCLHPKERLVEEGLIERIKNRGAFVKAYLSKEVEDLYAMREILELAGASSIPLPAPPKMIEELEDIHHRFIDALEHQDLRNVFRLNIAFHCALLSLTGKALMFETIHEFAQKAHGIRFIGITNTINLMRARDDHQAMIDAIKQQDRAKRSELCRAHILPSKEIYLELIGKFR